MSLSLYRKYRPLTFSEVIGQGHIVQTLSNAVRYGRIGHAYLFTGPRGTGKTTLARIFARAVNCADLSSDKGAADKSSIRHSEAGADSITKFADPCLKCDACKSITDGKSLDIFEIVAASNTGVDNIRELRENVKFPPTRAKYKVYIIDEVHMLSAGAFNALLKTLEEPPAHVIFILATTEIHKVPETIISRCQRYDFVRLPVESIVKKLSVIAKSEKIKIEKDALEMIAISAEGGMRDAESLLSQVISLEDKNITAKEVEEILGTTQRQSLEKLAGFILAKKTTEAIELINKLSQDGYDLDVFNKSFLNYLRQVMLVSVDENLAKLFAYELTKEQTASLAKQAKGHAPEEILSIIQCFIEIQGKIKSAFIPQLPLEMAIVKAVADPQKRADDDPKDPPTPKSGQAGLGSPLKPAQAQKMAHTQPFEPESDQTPPAKKTPSEPENDENESPFEAANLSLEDVKKSWLQIISELRQFNHGLSAILQSCQPVSIENGALKIAAKFPFHKDKLNDGANRLTVEKAFAKILGLRLRVKTVTSEETGIKIQKSVTSNQKPVTSNQEPGTSNQEIVSEEKKPSETSSLLTQALDIMGGAVVE
jgi:DNA polymerase III subunit gamma/tau